MPITTLDGAIAGFRVPQPIFKAGIAMAAVGAARGYTPWYANGTPGASTANSIGVNGQAVTPALASVGGRIPRANPSVGQNAHVGRLAVNANQAGSLWLIDRLWENSGLSATSTAAQNITPAAIPARDQNGATNGDGVMAAIEWSGTGGAGTPSISLSYTNQSGTAGRTATAAGVTTPPIGTFELFFMAPGDTGIRSVQSLTQSATRSSGAYHLVLFRPIATVDVTAANVGNAIDALTSGLPRIYDDSVLQLLWFPSGTAAAIWSGQYIETQG